MPTVTLGTTRLVVKAVERYAEPGLAADVLPGIAAGDGSVLPRLHRA
jgi:hypothetical protein